MTRLTKNNTGFPINAKFKYWVGKPQLIGKVDLSLTRLFKNKEIHIYFRFKRILA